MPCGQQGNLGSFELQAKCFRTSLAVWLKINFQKFRMIVIMNERSSSVMNSPGIKDGFPSSDLFFKRQTRCQTTR
jgi:hypothetical protein